MRRFASRTMPASWASAGSPDSRALSTASTATADATSPAFAPPMPSATANSGGRTTSESSFALRWRPTSVRPACSTIRSATRLLLVAIFAVADPDGVACGQALGRLDLAAVEIGAVGRPHVLEPPLAAAIVDARVRRRGERVLNADVGAVRAAEHGAVAHVEGGARLVTHRRHHDQPGSAAVSAALRAALTPSRARGLHR